MNDCSVNNGGVRLTGISAAMLAATLVAVLAVFALAKPSGAQDTTVTIEPLEIGFGAVEVSADAETRTVTITNNGETRLVIGGVSFKGPNGTTLDPGTFTTSLDTRRLRVGAGDTATFEVSFDPASEGFKEATATPLDLARVEIEGAPQVIVNGTGITTAPNAQPGAQPDCDITGTSNGEVLTGTPDPEVICALGGRDRVNGLGANDTLRGGRGNDRITDTAGRDKLLGQRGRDRLKAKDGARGDLLKGGPHKDRVFKDRGDRARSI